MTKLTDTKCRSAKPREKDYKLSDGVGLYLLVTKGGSKLWKWKYRYNGIEKKLSLGSYPVVSIKQARDAVARQRAVLAANADPSTEKRLRQLQAEFATATTFKAVGEEYIVKMEKEGRLADRPRLEGSPHVRPSLRSRAGARVNMSSKPHRSPSSSRARYPGRTFPKGAAIAASTFMPVVDSM